MPARGSKNRLRRADWDDARVPVTVGECGENSRGKNARSVKNSIERGEQSEEGTRQHTKDGKTTG